MLERDPELIFLRVLMDEWPADLDVGADRVSDGWWTDGDDDHQVTITHYNSTTDGETGYNYVGPDGTKISRVDGSVTIDVWIAYNDTFNSQGPAKDLRWQVESAVRSIIHANANGTMHEGVRELEDMGISERQRTTEDDRSPIIFRSRLRVSYHYFEHL